MDLINFIRVLWRRKWLILAITSIAVVTTFLIARQAPKVYKASAQLSTGITEGSGPVFSATQATTLQKYEIEARFKNMEEMVRSPQVLELVSYRLMLNDLTRTEPFRGLTDLRTRYTQEELRVARTRYQTRLDSMQTLVSSDELERKHIEMLRRMRYDYEALRSTLHVRRIPGTDFIGIEFSSENAYLSAFVVNTLCQEFVRYYAKVKAEQARNGIEFFTRMVEEKKAELDEKIKAWERTQGQEGGVSNVVNTTNEVLGRIGVLERQRDLANDELFGAERRLIELRQSFAQSDQQPYLDGELTRGTGSLAVLLRRRLSRLNEKYIRNNFRSSARDSLDAVADELTKELERAVAERYPSADEGRKEQIRLRIENELIIDLARERIQFINRELQQLGSTAGTFVAENSSPYGKEVEVARDAYLLVLNKLNEAKLSVLDVVAGNVSQVAFVQPPEKSEPSQTLLLTILSGLVSLGLCVVVLFTLEYLDTSVRFPSQFTARTGLAMVGVLNRLNTKNLDLVSLFSETQKNQSLESYKQLLRKIRHEVMSTGPRTLLITSTRPGTGKTSLLVSLAYSLSLNDKKVLLIDTNFKNNSLTKITGATPALEKYLHKEIPSKSLISNSVFEGVDVIGCEGGSYSPAEVLQPEVFENLLISLAESYDIILMEAPELNNYSDAKELMPYAAKTLAIFSATTGINAADKVSIQYLKSLDNKLMGAILNKVELNNLNR
ncbi:MAG: hypothetical protein OHK0039_25950 [Bacteroidia bacterium]